MRCCCCCCWIAALREFNLLLLCELVVCFVCCFSSLLLFFFFVFILTSHLWPFLEEAPELLGDWVSPRNICLVGRLRGWIWARCARCFVLWRRNGDLLNGRTLYLPNEIVPLLPLCFRTTLCPAALLFVLWCLIALHCLNRKNSLLSLLFPSFPNWWRYGCPFSVLLCSVSYGTEMPLNIGRFWVGLASVLYDANAPFFCFSMAFGFFFFPSFSPSEHTLNPSSVACNGSLTAAAAFTGHYGNDACPDGWLAGVPTVNSQYSLRSLPCPRHCAQFLRRSFAICFYCY